MTTNVFEYYPNRIDLQDLFFHQFSGGEFHIQIKGKISGTLEILARLNAPTDLVKLLTLLSALKAYKELHTIRLNIPYFPGARQDKRVEDFAAPLTAQFYAAAIRSAWDRHLTIKTLDIHSGYAMNQIGHSIRQTTAATDKSAVINALPINVIDFSQFDSDIIGIISPDVGAKDRAAQFRDKFIPSGMLLIAEKKRNQANGNITEYELPKILVPGKYLVVDDICDGGRTFLELAKKFREQENGIKSNLQLYVSHGIFSQGITSLSEHYSKIYTTDSFKTQDEYDAIYGRGITVLECGMSHSPSDKPRWVDN